MDLQALKELIESTEALDGQKDTSIIANVLNAPTLVDNPIAEADARLPKPLASVDELFAMILQGGNFEQDWGAVEKMAAFLTAGKVISEYCQIPFTGPIVGVIQLLQSPLFGLSESTAITAQSRLAETIPDPSWTAQITGPSLAQAAGLGRVTSAQCFAALELSE